MRIHLLAALIGCLCFTTAGVGQEWGTTPSDASAPQDFDAARDRLYDLEAETAALRAEIEALQQFPSSPEVAAEPIGFVPPPAVPPAPPADAAKPLTYDEFNGEMKKLVWTKGQWKVVPFGILWGAIEYETQKTIPGEFPIYVQSPSVTDHSAFYVDPRSTRFGLDVTGPGVRFLPDATIGGRLEFDFQRTLDTPNRAGVLFRQGYVEAKTDEYRLLIGQAWEVLSPLYPGSIMYIPGSGAGNLGYRRAQVRADRFFALSDDRLLTLQTSLNSNIISDFTNDPFIVGREPGWPVLEGRVAYTWGQRTGPDAIPITLGISGHIGEQQFDLPPEAPTLRISEPTWSFCLDARIPLTKQFGVQAEFFHGSNLGAYMGGILQGIDRNTQEGIRSTGGWVDLWYDWRPDLHSHLGYSIDDPLNSDVTVGRIYNDFWFANVVYDFTKAFNVGFEVSYWKTHFVNLEPGDSLRFETAVRYFF